MNEFRAEEIIVNVKWSFQDDLKDLGLESLDTVGIGDF